MISGIFVQLRKLSAFVFALLLATGLSACNFNFDFDFDSIATPPSYEEARQEAESRVAPTLEPPTILEEGVLTVGLRPANSLVPLTIVDENGTLSGVEIDLASALAGELGLSVRFVEITSIEEELGTSCDILMGVELGEDSAATVVGVYAERAATLFGHTDDMMPLSSLSGKTVGLQASSTSQEILSMSNLVMVERSFDSLNDAFDALDEGSVDYVLCEAYPGIYLASHYKNVSVAGTLEVPSTLGVAVATSNTALQTSVQAALDSLQANGAMGVIRARWLGGMGNLTNANLVEGIQLTTTTPEDDAEDAEAENEGETNEDEKSSD